MFAGIVVENIAKKIETQVHALFHPYAWVGSKVHWPESSYNDVLSAVDSFLLIYLFCKVDASSVTPMDEIGTRKKINFI